MNWYATYLTAQHLQRQRELEFSARRLEREARSGRRRRSDLPPFGRIRRPAARLLGLISAVTGDLAMAVDPQVSRG
jgi:hypothetical protein